MKKIIIMTQKSHYQVYFINKLAEFIKESNNLTLEGVFLGGRPKYLKMMSKNISKKGVVHGITGMLWNSIKTRVLRKYTYPIGNRYKSDVYNNIFGSLWNKIQPHKIYYQKNHPFSYWYSTIKKISPDIIIVHGGGIVSDKIISLANNHTFNLHWGISPIYRGSFCSPFCILNNEIHNIGVTIHELSSDIDGGKIYRTTKPEIEGTDTIFSIEMKLTKLGTHLIQDLLDTINKGKKPPCKKQDIEKGNMYLIKEYTLKKAYKINRLIRKGIIHDYCIRHTKKNR